MKIRVELEALEAVSPSSHSTVWPIGLKDMSLSNSNAWNNTDIQVYYI